ncbi:MAG: radical SAM family heme chaperone HemW [Oscillospiraceae bacterium]|nr:radical SAM family heme chaperone HemW [Oscillospiraceae bacterium]
MTAKEQSPLGLYIHIPFCRSKCVYCDFYSLAGREADMDRYQTALLAHIRQTAPLAAHTQVDTVYFGGGTPSYYGHKRLCALLSALKKQFHLRSDAEITVEANPDSVDFKTLKRLRRAGFNRLSLGVQSACDDHLCALNRPHDFAQARQAVADARRAGFDNLSLDLIYGLPHQTMAQWQDTVEQVLTLEPEHLSCYGLKVEENTPLFRQVEQGLAIPDDDAQADMYLWTVSRLAQAGYEQYEISNFARGGRQSRHNLRYWLTQPYIGFGPGAHSDFGSRRYSMVRDLDAYISGVLEGKSIIDQSDLIPDRERCGEYLMLRLRTTRGIEEWEYRRTYFMNFEPLESLLQNYADHGWAVYEQGRWHFTPEGFLVSNQLIGQLMDAQQPSSLETLLSRLRRARPE